MPLCTDFGHLSCISASADTMVLGHNPSMATQTTTMMQAIAIDGYGRLDKLQLRDLPIPEPKAAKFACGGVSAASTRVSDDRRRRMLRYDRRP